MPEEVTASPVLIPYRPQRALFWGLLAIFLVWMAILGTMWLKTVHDAPPLPPIQPVQREILMKIDPSSIPPLPPPTTAP